MAASFWTASTSSNDLSTRSQPLVDELLNKYTSSISSTTYHNSPPPPPPPPPPQNFRLRDIFNRNRRHRNILHRFIDRIRLEYYRYQVTYGVYVMTPGERFAANVVLFLVFWFLFWAALLYVPAIVLRKMSDLGSS